MLPEPYRYESRMLRLDDGLDVRSMSVDDGVMGEHASGKGEGSRSGVNDLALHVDLQQRRGGDLRQNIDPYEHSVLDRHPENGWESPLNTMID